MLECYSLEKNAIDALTCCAALFVMIPNYFGAFCHAGAFSSFRKFETFENVSHTDFSTQEKE